MTPDPQIINDLAVAHEAGKLILPLPMSIRALRSHLSVNRALLKADPTDTELLDLIERQRTHLEECEQALLRVLTWASGPEGEGRCPICHRRQETRGGVFKVHRVEPDSPFCSGSGRTIPGRHRENALPTNTVRR